MKVITPIGSLPISHDFVYLRDNGHHYSKRSATTHVLLKKRKSEVGVWEEVKDSDEVFRPHEVVEAFRIRHT